MFHNDWDTGMREILCNASFITFDGRYLKSIHSITSRVLIDVQNLNYLQNFALTERVHFEHLPTISTDVMTLRILIQFHPAETKTFRKLIRTWQYDLWYLQLWEL